MLIHNHLVGINQGITKGLGQVPTNRGLARSHEAYEDDILLHVDFEKNKLLNSIYEVVFAKLRPWKRNK